MTEQRRIMLEINSLTVKLKILGNNDLNSLMQIRFLIS